MHLLSPTSRSPDACGKDENSSSARVGPSPGLTFDQKHNSPFWGGWNVIKEPKTRKSYSMRRFGARAERIVFRVRGYLDGGTNLDLLGSFGNPQKVNFLADISRFSCLFIDRGLFSCFPLARTRKPGRGNH